MRARRIVALKLVIDLRRRVEKLLQIIGADERRRTEHPIKIEDPLRNGNALITLIELLLDARITKYRRKIVARTRLLRRGIQKRRMLRLHVRFDVVPCLWHLLFRKINFVRNVLCGHRNPSSFSFSPVHGQMSPIRRAAEPFYAFCISLRVCLLHKPPRKEVFPRARKNDKKTRNNPYGTNRSVLPPNFTAERCLFLSTIMLSFCNGKAPSDATSVFTPALRDPFTCRRLSPFHRRELSVNRLWRATPSHLRFFSLYPILPVLSISAAKFIN